MTDWVINKDVLVNGVPVTASPMFGLIGAGATAIILFTTHKYARNAVTVCYESSDGKRLGFQTHTTFGNPGRKFEVPIGNATLSSTKVASFSSSMIVRQLYYIYV